MANIVIGQAIRRNAFEYVAPKVVGISGIDAFVGGVFWRVPVVDQAGFLSHFDYQIANKPKPSADSAKVVRVHDRSKSEIFFLVIGDDKDEKEFTDKANACCDSATSMPVVTVPLPVLEVKGCKDAAGNYNYFGNVGDLSGNQVYQIRAAVNGVLLTGQAAGGYASLATLKTFLTSNWGSSGTWDAKAVTDKNYNQVSLVSTTATSAMIEVQALNYFESATLPTLSGSNVFTATVTVNGVPYPVVKGGTTAQSLADACNADVRLSTLGVFVVASSKLRILTSASAATIVAGQAAP